MTRSTRRPACTSTLAALLLAAAGSLHAAEDIPPGATEAPADAVVPIGPEEWWRMVQGRTVTYLIGGDFWAREAYDTASRAVEIQLDDGTCMKGTWSHRDGAFCFAWSGGENSCFLHLRDAGRILIVPLLPDGGTGTMQTVAGISTTPLACGPALSS